MGSDPYQVENALAQVYDHLLGTGLMSRTTDFENYVKSLGQNLAELQGAPEGKVILTCDRDSLILDLDVVTALGIVLTELVTNSYDHAFPGRKGSIRVSARRVAKRRWHGDHDDQR
jgi:two-component sensor histidine kinase